jgi:hypothetical protein
MPYVGFEPTIPAFERAKTVHALDRSATVTGLPTLHNTIWQRNRMKLLVIELSPLSGYFFPVRFIYFPQHAVLKDLFC